MDDYGNEVVVAIIASTMLVLALFSIITTILWQSQKRRSEYFRKQQLLKAEYEQEVLKTQLETQNHTLQQISAELHDNLGQLLTIVRMNLNVLEEDPASPKQITQRIIDTNELVATILQYVRSMSKGIDFGFVEQYGLLDAYRHELNRINQTGRFKTELLVRGEQYSLGFDNEVVLLRIAQEFLANSIKYSRATAMRIAVTYQADYVEITLNDNGVGMDLTEVARRSMLASGSGLRNIRRRIEMIGGQHELHSKIGEGVSLIITVPAKRQDPTG
ncbi:sensor histidine kinase [Dyadobacter sp. 3J3]|uniref:sensor histidine kinase n=1 Tax=Dyadobacter sp. 3J3 TaxID=2606600 RepID=UPI00135AB766|nr:ATP-binding protein [Dyadobacter sp. 3J3]